MTAKELDELEGLWEASEAAFREQRPLAERTKTLLDANHAAYKALPTLIAAARERDALLKVVEAAEAVSQMLDNCIYFDAQGALDVQESEFHYGPIEDLEDALAQHRGEAGGTDE
jgi:hypothetical protein